MTNRVATKFKWVKQNRGDTRFGSIVKKDGKIYVHLPGGTGISLTNLFNYEMTKTNFIGKDWEVLVIKDGGGPFSLLEFGQILAGLKDACID